MACHACMARATRLPTDVTIGLPVVPVSPREDSVRPATASKPSAEEWQTLVDLKNKLATLETRLVEWSQRLEAREAALDASNPSDVVELRLREQDQKVQRDVVLLRRREAACAEREAAALTLQQQRDAEYDSWVAEVEAQRAKWSAMHVRVDLLSFVVLSRSISWSCFPLTASFRSFLIWRQHRPKFRLDKPQWTYKLAPGKRVLLSKRASRTN